jgi:hypothetical protein
MLALEREEISYRIKCVLEARAMYLQITTNPLHFAKQFGGKSVGGVVVGILSVYLGS